MSDVHTPFVKVTKRLSPHLHLLRGSMGVVYVWCVLNQDEDGIVDADMGHIMADTGLGKATIDSAADNLQAVGLVQPFPPRQKNCASYSLAGDFSRYGAGAPTGDVKTFAKKLFDAPYSSGSSLSVAVKDVNSSIEAKDEQQLPLQLPPDAGAREAKSFDGPVSPFEVYAREIGALTPIVGDKLGDWVDELGAAAVIEAIRIAVLQNVRKLSYVEGILKKKANGNGKTEADGSRFITGRFADEIHH